MKIETGIARKIWPCNHNGCKKKIEKSQEYFLWHVQGTAQRQHQAHGQPAAKVTKKKAATKKVAKQATKKGKGGKK